MEWKAIKLALTAYSNGFTLATGEDYMATSTMVNQLLTLLREQVFVLDPLSMVLTAQQFRPLLVH